MEEYKLAICQLRVLDGVIVDYARICDLTMCKNCESWHHKEESFGSCDVLGLITYDKFSCLDGTKRE